MPTQCLRFYERKRRQRHALLAVKALAHRLTRACFYVPRDQVFFAPERLFAQRRFGQPE